MKRFDFFAHAVRAKEIFTILAKHGFADFVSHADLPAGLRRTLLSEPAAHRSTHQRVRLAAEELGPTFVKFGQLLSMRPDLVPYPLIVELRKLQDQVRPLPFAEMKPLLEQELGNSPAEIFDTFEETPAASASLAQVYFATLKTDGLKVAVKVQKPGITHNVEIDLDLAAWLAAQLHQRSHTLHPYDLPTIVEEVRAGILLELDFRNEARNQEYFNTLNPHPEQVFAPSVVWELTTERVLVMERVEGKPVSQADFSPEKRKEIAGNGARSVFHQILVSGFFHADPHSGNVYVTPDGRLAFIDWGLAGHLTRRLRSALAEFWTASVDQDAERIVRIVSEFAPTDARPDVRRMEKEVTLALRDELNFATGRQNLGRAMVKLLYIFGRNGIPMSRDYSLMAKAILSIEEVGRMLDPGFDLRPFADPVIRAVQRERSSPKSVYRAMRDLVGHAFTGLQELPSEFRKFIRRLEQDNLTINFQHRGLEGLSEALRVASNRVALGVIIGSLIIGSSFVIHTGIGPSMFGYPALGLVGYVLSALFGLYVIWDIVRHGRNK